MTIEDIFTQFEALGDEKRRAHNAKYGAGDNDSPRGKPRGIVVGSSPQVFDYQIEWYLLA